MLNPTAGYLDASGNFDPRVLPLTDVYDRDRCNVLYVYFRPAYRLAWFLADNPVTGPIRLLHSMQQDSTGTYCEARVVNLDEPEYLCDENGQVRCIPGETGAAVPLRNPKHILFSDRKYAKGASRFDPHESAITGAIGRVLARAGYGTESLLALLNDSRSADPEDEEGAIVDTPARVNAEEQLLGAAPSTQSGGRARRREQRRGAADPPRALRRARTDARRLAHADGSRESTRSGEEEGCRGRGASPTDSSPPPTSHRATMPILRLRPRQNCAICSGNST